MEGCYCAKLNVKLKMLVVPGGVGARSGPGWLGDIASKKTKALTQTENHADLNTGANILDPEDNGATNAPARAGE